jgi:hypothetical protein
LGASIHVETASSAPTELHATISDRQVKNSVLILSGLLR